MTKWFTQIWVGAAVILPALIGLALLFAPAQLATPTTTLDSLAGMVGARELIYSGLIVTAALMLVLRALGVLMVGRGLIDLSDGLRALPSGQPARGAAVPVVFAVLSFAVAYLLLREPTASPALAAAASGKGARP